MMTPYKLLTFTALIICLISSSRLFGQNTTEKLDYDTSRIAIIKFEHQKSLRQVFDSTYNATHLSNNDLIVIEELTIKSIEQYNSKCDLRNRKDLRIEDFLKKYIRQYVPVENQNGKKIVYVYCVCYHPYMEETKWRERLMLVDDGSRCVFRLKIDLSNKKTISEIRINGAG